MKNLPRRMGVATIIVLSAALTASSALAQAKKLRGKVKINGSSTVAPIMAAAAEMFRSEQPMVQVIVGISGTGGGFTKFLDPKPELRTDINDASRPITPSEIDLAKKNGVDFIELPIGLDGIALVVHPSNTFCDHLTLSELKVIWEPGSKVSNWKDVRAGFPDLPLKLYGPGHDSGTFDFFTEAVNGKAKTCRSDFTASENDNVLVQGVEGDKGALGYFGFSYYEGHRDKLKLLAVDSGDRKPIKPELKTIHDGTYYPLSRPLFIYVNKASAARAEVDAFVSFVLSNAKRILEHPAVNYVAMDKELYAAAGERWKKRVTGSAFAAPNASKKKLAELYGGK